VGAFSAGYAFNQEWATQTWPWPDGDFSHIFFGSILAAIAAIGVWIGSVGDWGALKTGGLSLFVMFGGCSIYLFIRAADGHDVGYAIVFAAVAGAGAALGFAFRKVPIADRRLMPVPVRASFVGVVALLVTAGALLLARVQIFPWAVDVRSAAMFGCIAWGRHRTSLLRCSARPGTALAGGSWPSSRTTWCCSPVTSCGGGHRHLRLPQPHGRRSSRRFS